MGFLAWVCVPLLRDQLGGRDPFIESLLICLNVGLLWILALTLILLRRGTLDFLQRLLGLVRAACVGELPSSGGRGAVLPRTLASANAQGVRTDRLGRQRDYLWPLPPAPAMEYARQHPRRGADSGLSHEAVSEHLDRAHHAHPSELRHHRGRSATGAVNRILV